MSNDPKRERAIEGILAVIEDTPNLPVRMQAEAILDSVVDDMLIEAGGPGRIFSTIMWLESFRDHDESDNDFYDG